MLIRNKLFAQLTEIVNNDLIKIKLKKAFIYKMNSVIRFPDWFLKIYLNTHALFIRIFLGLHSQQHYKT